MLKSLPVQLCLCILLGLCFGSFLSDVVISFFYTISCFLKDLLMIGLPFIIFSYLFAALLSFERHGLWMVVTVMGCIVLSNAAAVLIPYAVGAFLLPLLPLHPIEVLPSAQSLIQPLWKLPFSNPLSAQDMLIFGLISGLIAAFFKSAALKKMAFSLRDGATKLLQKTFIPFIPLYVLGFVLKLNREGSLYFLITSYAPVFLSSCTLITLYLLFLYAFAAHFQRKIMLKYLEQMLPAGLMAFSTMSSAAALPITLKATEDNLGSRAYADFVIPLTTNIHLLGDGINISLTCLALLMMTGEPFPDFSSYLIFTIFYCLTKFSAAGVPGGGVLVILPVAQAYLGLSPEMSTLLFTIYVLQDPLISAANVMGNGAFALITAKIFTKTRTSSCPQE